MGNAELTAALVLAEERRYVLIELSVGGQTMGDEAQKWRNPSREAAESLEEELGVGHRCLCFYYIFAPT